MNKRFLSKVTRAFTLIELVASVAIISTFAALVGPALATLSGTAGTSKAAIEVSAALEHARQSAMRLNTWVWVGVADTTQLNEGQAQLSIVELASRDGTDDTSKDNLMALANNRRINNVKFVTGTSDTDAVTLGTQASPVSLSWPVAAQDVNFTGQVIGFSPKGEAVLQKAAIPNWIRLPISDRNNAKDTVSILVSGLSGQVIVSR